MDRRSRNLFLAVHGTVLALILLFPLYGRVMEDIPRIFRGCILHDFLFVYCPMCGGTRALQALLRLELWQALRSNAMIVLFVLGAIAWDIRAAVRLWKGKTEIYRIPAWIWIVVGTVFLLFGIVRNVLMIVWGIDPLGDLGVIWNR